MSVAVIIPIYKAIPNCEEESSLRNTMRVLSSRDIIIITYKELDLKYYREISFQEKKKVSFMYFDSSYFKGTESYNHLCMSLEFYKAFINYKYILICHWDAWVFSDQLDYWCSKEYDIIGAPWFRWNYISNDFDRVLSDYSGNGGFTLRKIDYFIRTLQSKKPVRKASILKNETHWNSMKSIMRFFLHLVGWHNNINYYVKLCKSENEDYFWCAKFRGTRFEPKIPASVEAASFAFEKYPSLLYDKIGKELPFGCHKYLNNEYESFWKQFIKNSNY